MNAATAEQAETASAASGKKKTEIESVTMNDGRVVSFTGKSKVSKDFLVGGRPFDELTPEEQAKAHIQHAAVRFDFRNGTTRTYPLNHELALRFAGHGALQKYGDQLAGEDAPDLDDWAASLDTLHEQLKAGDWRKARTGGSFGGVSVLLQALMEFTGRTADEVRAHIKDWTPQDRQAMRNDPDIKPIVERIEREKAEKASKNVDTAGLKASLKGLAA